MGVLINGSAYKWECLEMGVLINGCAYKWEFLKTFISNSFQLIFCSIISWKLGQCWSPLGTNAEETGFKVCLQILHFYYGGWRLY